MRFSAARRLRTATEFSRVRSEGRTQSGRFFLVNVLTLPGTGAWRSGIITTRKIGGAVQRNQARRRVREIIRHAGLCDGVWVVTVVKRQAVNAGFSDLQEDWLRSARRAGILQPDILPEGGA